MAAVTKMAWRNVRKHWRHSLAATLTISAGFVALALFEGYMKDLRERYGDRFRLSSMLGDLIVERRGAAQVSGDPWAAPLRPADQRIIDAFLAASPEVDVRSRELELSGMVDGGGTGAVFLGRGYDVAAGLAMRSPGWERNVVAGVPLDQGDAASIVIGSGLAQVVGCSYDTSGSRGKAPPLTCAQPRLQLSATTETGQLNAVEPVVVGVTSVGLAEMDLRFVYLPLPLAQRLVNTENVSRYTVRLKDPAGAVDLAARLTAYARARGLELDALPWRAHRLGEMFVRSMTILSMFRNFVVLVVLIIAGMAVLNTMAKSVGERVHEIGTLRSLGFRRGHVIRLFTTEAALLAALAAVLGLALAAPMAWGLSHAGVRYKAGFLTDAIPLVIAIVPGTYVTGALFLGLIATLAAYLPARRAAALSIPAALGHV
jgi:putative ABC transport system permease protein